MRLRALYGTRVTSKLLKKKDNLNLMKNLFKSKIQDKINKELK